MHMSGENVIYVNFMWGRALGAPHKISLNARERIEQSPHTAPKARYPKGWWRGAAKPREGWGVRAVAAPPLP